MQQAATDNSQRSHSLRIAQLVSSNFWFIANEYGWFVSIFCRHWFSNFFTKSRRLLFQLPLFCCQWSWATNRPTVVPSHSIHNISSSLSLLVPISFVFKFSELLRDECIREHCHRINTKRSTEMVRSSRNKNHKHCFHCIL